jgi:hypothetical protein
VIPSKPNECSAFPNPELTRSVFFPPGKSVADGTAWLEHSFLEGRGRLNTEALALMHLIQKQGLDPSACIGEPAYSGGDWKVNAARVPRLGGALHCVRLRVVHGP